ncbi:MAG: hypothetical protein R3F11_32605 [Verrucomicrobiales bacterium]
MEGGSHGAGYDRNPDYAGSSGSIWNLRCMTAGRAPSLRIPFAVIDPADIASLTLRMK